MAVIGSKDSLNRDPAKMVRFSHAHQGVGIIANNAFKSTADANYFMRANVMTAFITSNSVVNTARTVYSVSGKGGSLIWAFGSTDDNGQTGLVTTWVITVDGVATTVSTNASFGNYYDRGFLGTPAAYDDGVNVNSHTIFPESAYQFGAQGGASGGYRDTNGSDMEMMGPTGDGSIVPYTLLAGLSQPTINPQACIRFENSLTITVSTNKANSDTGNKNAGVLVKLDS